MSLDWNELYRSVFPDLVRFLAEQARDVLVALPALAEKLQQRALVSSQRHPGPEAYATGLMAAAVDPPVGFAHA